MKNGKEKDPSSSRSTRAEYYDSVTSVRTVPL